MADRLGKQFYSRCPEHMKPVLWRKTSPSLSGEKAAVMEETNGSEPIDVEKAVDDGSGEDRSRESPTPIVSTMTTTTTPSTRYLRSRSQSRWLRNPFKRAPKHDTTKDDGDTTPPERSFRRIFLGALHATLWWRWWLAAVLKLTGGEFFLLRFFHSWAYLTLGKTPSKRRHH